MKTILIAIDYNPSAEKIAETGYALAKAMDAKVVLLHVMADVAYYSASQFSPIMGFNNFNPTNALLPETINDMRRGVEEFLSHTREHLGDTGIETIVKDGDTADTIISTAVEKGADTIVLGSHSRRGLEKILMGSVSEKVLHHSKIPLFIIPTRE
jgi:nucleotide-binding universal stress UspA family protein